MEVDSQTSTRADEEMVTVFDKIAAGELPCDKLYEDDLAMAFRDINPTA